MAASACGPQQLVDMIAVLTSNINSAHVTMNGTLSTMNGTLMDLSSRVKRLEDRLGEPEGGDERRARKRRRTSEVEEAQQALAAMTAANAAAQEAAARCQAEKEKLHATLIAIRDAGQCPIKHEFTDDMVVASDGQSYDRQAIQQWRQRNNTSPITREQLVGNVFPNRFAQKVFDELQKIGICSAESRSAAGGLCSFLSIGASCGERPSLLTCMRGKMR
jgi:predicted nuclease with TOPRIM domain